MGNPITWNDINSGTCAELKKVYKVDDKGLEVQMRKHLDGANQKQMQKFYETFYRRQK